MDEGKSVHITYVDFTKTFNTIPHSCIVNKFSRLNVNPYITHWIAAWLTNRTEKIKVGGYIFSKRHVISGVPQSTVLVSYLFGIYFFEIKANIKSLWLTKFADDFKLGVIINSTEDTKILQKGLYKTNSSCQNYGLKLNAKKCITASFIKKGYPYSYHIDNIPMKTDRVVRDLGSYPITYPLL